MLILSFSDLFLNLTQNHNPQSFRPAGFCPFECSLPWASGFGLGALGFEPWALGLGLWAFGLWALGFGLWALGVGLWALGFGLLPLAFRLCLLPLQIFATALACAPAPSRRSSAPRPLLWFLFVLYGLFIAFSVFLGSAKSGAQPQRLCCLFCSQLLFLLCFCLCPWALGPGPLASGLGPWASGLGLGALGPGPLASGLGPWAWGLGPWTLGPWALDLGPWALGLGP